MSEELGAGVQCAGDERKYLRDAPESLPLLFGLVTAVYAHEVAGMNAVSVVGNAAIAMSVGAMIGTVWILERDGDE